MRPSLRKSSALSLAGLTAAIVMALFASSNVPAGEPVPGSIVVAAKKPTKTEAEPTKPAPKPAAVDPDVAALAAANARVAKGDYEAARWHPIHFKPAIDKATDADCLACHSEILKAKPRAASEAGVPADKTEAWYQTLDTYAGAQADFHVRHLSTPFAKQVMNLSCTFCHQGNDPREESPDVTVPPAHMTSWNGKPPFTLRKMVNTSETCLRCHGQFPWQNMEGLSGPWHEIRADMEPEGTPNGCTVCHETIRTERHKVTYLKAAGIDEAAKDSSDSCYGCHGGRAWYRISYPYPRTPWPDMPKDTPEWAKSRPTASDARFRLQGK